MWTQPLQRRSSNYVTSFPSDASQLQVGQYFALTPYIVYPLSRGYVHITGPELSDTLAFEAGILADADEIDVKKCRWAYKMQRGIARRMETYRGEVASSHPRFPKGSQAVCIETDEPLPVDVKDIEYTAEDDVAIEEWIRENLATTWHSLGICKMASLEKLGVVDACLNVYGVTGLKIADLSIPSSNVAANTNNTAMVIGEKAADIFIAELGLLESN